MTLVRKHDHVIDQLAMKDFCEFAGYTIHEFWCVVDKFYNTDLFYKDINGQWVLKE
jgi:hypothetical protein